MCESFKAFNGCGVGNPARTHTKFTVTEGNLRFLIDQFNNGSLELRATARENITIEDIGHMVGGCIIMKFGVRVIVNHDGAASTIDIAMLKCDVIGMVVVQRDHQT